MIAFLQAILGDMISMVVVAAVVGGMYKVFQIATSLNEIKDLLADIKRNTREYAPTAVSSPRLSESPLRGIGTELDPSSVPASVLDSER